jgi:hypothetical protein
MKKLLISVLMFVGCATTSVPETYTGKYSVGTCIQPNEKELAQLPPTSRDDLAKVIITVTDKGTTFYVIEGVFQGSVVFRDLVPLKQLEDISVEVDCKK